MAIHPIDLSTVYSQLDNVAKYGASQNQNADMASMLGVSQKVQADMRKAESVQETGKNQETDSANIKDGKNSSPQGNANRGQNSKQEETEAETNTCEIQDPRLGRIIDISG